MTTLTEYIISHRQRFNAATDDATIHADLTWGIQPGQAIITQEDPRYPSLLKEIYDPPLLLYVKGNTAHLQSEQIAIVGSRNPSPAGLEFAAHFASSLVEKGFAITSGLALGIDGASHRGALDAKGVTFAVLGHGLNTLYPKRHRGLSEQLMEQGALISEFPLETPIRPPHFPRRNRIISGLSVGTLVVEATLNSGSLITARLACEQGREVFAIPGSIYNPQSQGCHALLRQGATLVEEVDDILAEIRFEQKESTPRRTKTLKSNSTTGLREAVSRQIQNKTNPKSLPKLEEEQRQLLECVAFETTPVDQIVCRSSFSAQKVSSLLLSLELHGYIKGVSGGYRRTTG